jgi:hypothetical protein
MERDKEDQQIANLCKQALDIHAGNTVAKCDSLSNENLWERTKHKETWKEIRYRKWKWIGHTLRQNNECIANKVLEWNPQGGRRKDPGLHGEAVRMEADHQGKNWPEIKCVKTGSDSELS